jgi:hypothetical protein
MVTDDQAPFIENSFKDTRFDLLLGAMLAIDHPVCATAAPRSSARSRCRRR